jgi:hypothetical protein
LRPRCGTPTTRAKQLGIEAHKLTTTIGQLAEQLEADDDDSRAQTLDELEDALLAEEGILQLSPPRPTPPAG